MANPKDDEINYDAEGATPPREKNDSTDEGYAEAVRPGPGRYGVPEGEGGVFGTTGGGTYQGGFHEVERPVIEGTEKGEDERNEK